MARGNAPARRLRAVAAVLALAAVAPLVRAQSRPPNYNFFDSRGAPPLPAARALAAPAGQSLTPPSSADAETVARALLEQLHVPLGIESTAVFSLRLERRYRSEAAGLTHLLFERRHAGIAVFGGEALVHVADDGSVVALDPGAPWPDGADPPVSPALTAQQAAESAAAALGSGASAESAPARLVWFPRTNDAVLAWELYLHFDAARWYCVLVDRSEERRVGKECRL